MKCVNCGHEIAEEALFCSYCGEKVAGGQKGEEEPIYLADVKSMLKSGRLAVYLDRVEFISSSVQKTVFNYSSLVSVKKGLDRINFLTEDGRTESCVVNRKNIHEAFLYIEKASGPYIEERNKNLLSRGIKYSFASSMGLIGGILNVSDDKAEFKSKTGQSTFVFFKDVRTVRLNMGMLEFSLTDGTSRVFTVDMDICNEVLSFVENAVNPYVVKRTVDFDTVFGIDEKVEINEKRGVFHIIRQNGKEITEEQSVREVIKCERVECSTPDSMLSSVLLGGMSILNSAVKTVSAQNSAAEAGEKISYAGVILTVHTEQGERTESIRFGDFPLGMSRTNKKYEGYITEISRFMDYLGSNCPECELVVPVLPEVESESVEIPAISAVEEEKAASGADAAEDKDRFGIIKYIEGVSGFIDECAAPMTIAIQGNWGSGENDIMKMLAGNLEERYKDNLIWFHTWQFSQSDSGEQFPILVGNRLVSLLGGSNNAAAKERAVKAAKGFINITSGFISQGSTDGQNLIGALFKDNSTNPLEKIVRDFEGLVRKRINGTNNKVIIFVDDLEKLTPAKGVKVLEAMRNFFDCEGCVFVMAADYGTVISGAEEIYGQSFDESKGKNFFDKLFQVSFRVPVSGYNIQNYVKDKLEHMEISVGDEKELGFYVELIRNSVGSEPKNMDHLFNSFLLLKKLADEEMYRDRNRRLTLFALLCMQARFHDIYSSIVREQDRMTPHVLSELCTEQPEILNNLHLNDDEKIKFREFAVIFCDIIDMDNKDSISESESKMFKEVLEFSSITAK